MPATEKKLTRSKSGMKIVPMKDTDRSPLELPEPAWVKDSERSNCDGCQVKFDFFCRRHHCRRCGNIFCDGCSNSKISLPRMCFLDPVRICKNCTEVTEKEREFYENGLQHLISGTTMIVSFSDSPEESHYTECALSSDHRYLLMPGSGHPSVPFYKIVGKMTSSGDDLPSGFAMSVRGDDLRFQLELPINAPARGQNFLEAIKTAIQMVEEARPVVGTGN